MPHTFTDWAMLYVIVALVLCVLGYCHLQWQTKVQANRFSSPNEAPETMRARMLLALSWPLVALVIAITLMIALIFFISERVNEITTFKAVSDSLSLDNLGSMLILESEELISEDDLLPDDRVALEALRRDIARFETTDGLDS